MGQKLSYQSLSTEQIKLIANEYYAERQHQTKPQELPIAVLVAGQPGAGKSAAAKIARFDLKEMGGYIHIDADRMREEIPTNGIRYPSADTQQDAGHLVQALRAEAIAEKRNIIEEGSFRDADTVKKFINGLVERGYQVEMLAIAASREESLLGIYQRYETQIKYGAENPRILTDEYHDLAFNGFNNTVRECETCFSRVRISNRDGKILYDSQNTKQGQTAYAVLQSAQQQTPEKLAILKKSWRLVKTEAEARGETDLNYLNKIQDNLKHVENLHRKMDRNDYDHDR